MSHPLPQLLGAAALALMLNSTPAFAQARPALQPAVAPAPQVLPAEVTPAPAVTPAPKHKAAKHKDKAAQGKKAKKAGGKKKR